MGVISFSMLPAPTSLAYPLPISLACKMLSLP